MKLHFVFALAILIKYAGAQCIKTPICTSGCAPDENCTVGKCVCNGSMYQNLTIGNFHPTIVCENSIITVGVNQCQLDLLGYDPSSIHLRETGENCSYFFSNISNGSRRIFVQTEAASNWCGNTVESDESNIYISNTIYIDIKKTDIITKNPIKFNYTCGYTRNMQTSLQLPGNITTQTVDLTGINGTGLYPVTMSAYKDLACTIPFTNDDTVVVGSDIFVGIFVAGADSDIFVLRIEKCTASPTEDRNGPNNFVLIENGCAKDTVSADIYVKENGNSTEALFRISSFKFQNYDSVYITCDVRLCEKSNGTCSKCAASGKSSNIDTNEIQIGLNIEAKYDFADNAGINTVASWALLLGIQAAFLFIKFF
ncbi:PREDICTED: pancreatic secretory granule membrane major glycoprotein GP2-like [Nanorana parkeri]|uniref:pancreatic secretory granule membrane major glycoprotein GP2-like n=1 Tax=Nanorana parkeri TaxID=125878 RepID=UPI000854F320|nr:PREDICTED: pancreatic secretory granule membrane major glycoprotein GP2-like [Nanorana parkeri]